VKLQPKLVEKPWGRTDVPSRFGDTAGCRIGEVWFPGPDDLPLLVKYLFTSEQLSIQVHPSDEQARARGLRSGKEECWLILDAEPGARLGLGLNRETSREDLRQAALDGSIEQLIDWKPVRAGDFFYVPAGTIHAIGGGLSLIEFQQNADVTYRLYDYGRPRELHLDDGIAVSRPEPYRDERARHVSDEQKLVLVDGPKFSLVRAKGEDPFPGRRRWVVPLYGDVQSGEDSAGPGECLLLEAGEQLRLGTATALVGCEGSI
jgi:mannose-6-phosphate isomerase